MSAPTLELAILDDYQNIGFRHFEKVYPERLQISVFEVTLNTKDPKEKDELIKRLRPFTIISTMRERTPFPADVINALPNLKLLHTTGMGNAAIDMNAAAERGIIVAGTTGKGRSDGSSARPPSLSDSTTQHTWALILGITRNIARDDAVVKSGGWQSSLTTGLTGKTLGLLGLVRLGSSTARIGVLAFGMKVIAWSSSLTQETADRKAKEFGLPAGTFKVVTKEELFRHADVLSVHYVLSDRSRGIVGAKELELMKRTSFLVNTSRGPLIEETPLLYKLEGGKIRGAALDVFDTEPLPLDSEWRTTKWGQDGRSDVLLSPHMGYVEEETMHNWYDETAENVERWIDGKEVLNRIN